MSLFFQEIFNIGASILWVPCFLTPKSHNAVGFTFTVKSIQNTKRIVLLNYLGTEHNSKPASAFVAQNSSRSYGDKCGGRSGQNVGILPGSGL